MKSSVCLVVALMCPAACFAQSHDNAVITISYRCPPQPECSASVSAAEFDLLVKAIDPAMSEAGRQGLAAEYARLLIMSAEARRRGLDRKPEMHALVQFAAMQALASRLVKEIASTPPKVTDEEVETYYREHSSDYQHLTLSRVAVPKNTAGGKNANPPRENAEQLRLRAQAGEDFTALQREVPAGPPNAYLENMRCLALSPEHRSVCMLEPGQISPVLESWEDLTFYRMEARRPIPLSDVKEAIRNQLARDRLQKEIEIIRNPLTLDLETSYFGKLPSPDVASHHGMHFPASSGAPAAAKSASSSQHRH